MHVFEMWEKVWVLWDNPRRHKENMWSPHRKAPARIWTRTFLLWGDDANRCTAVLAIVQTHIVGQEVLWKKGFDHMFVIKKQMTSSGTLYMYSNYYIASLLCPSDWSMVQFLALSPHSKAVFGFEPCVWVELFCLGFLSQYKDVKLHPEDSPTIYTCHISKHVAQFQLPI